MTQACWSLTCCYIFPISHSMDKFWVPGLSRLALHWKRMKSRRSQSHHGGVRASWSLRSSKYLGTHQMLQGLQQQQLPWDTSPCGKGRCRDKPGGHISPHTWSLVCTLLAAWRVLPAISHPKKVQQLGSSECFFIPDLRREWDRIRKIWRKWGAIH